MTTYRFRAVTAADQPQIGQLEASSSSDANRQLLDRGLFPVEVTVARASLWTALQKPLGNATLSRSETIQFSSDLAHLANAGVEVAAALSILKSTTKRPKVHAFASKLSETIREGRPLSEALSRSGAYPKPAIAVVRAGEASGSLGSSLQRIADDLRREDDTKRKLRTALIYPACIAVAALGAILVLLLFVVPSLESLFGDSVERLSWQTQTLIFFSQSLRSHGFTVGLSAIVLTVVVATTLRQPVVRLQIEKLAIRAPLLKTLIIASETARLARLLAVLGGSRLPLDTAMTLIADGAQLSLTKHALENAARHLRAGRSLSQALGAIPTLSPRLLALIGVGETTGRMTEMIEEGARGAEQAVNSAIERFLVLLTPAMTVFFGGIAGFVLYAVMTAILSVNDIATLGR